ncbi:hypothetical protein AK812_SmicGene35496 [Symbiodinium microadriaticum]|uniref:Uncharacterized protein n=1 Tax=Symbiodinium microadriaticum TaxID=2951 RepID=A0A1Q9CLA2_SYMMI|nr:hypothetical protein AK812_SmicGene35496 [Symbiodinium microadriaticum]
MHPIPIPRKDPERSKKHAIMNVGGTLKPIVSEDEGRAAGGKLQRWGLEAQEKWGDGDWEKDKGGGGVTEYVDEGLHNLLLDVVLALKRSENTWRYAECEQLLFDAEAISFWDLQSTISQA